MIRDTGDAQLPLLKPRTRHQEIAEQCKAFHAEHPEVYDLFERFARDAWDRGARKIGAKLVWERLRWEQRVVEGREEGEIKLNNNFPAHYARRFQRLNPELADVFETRAQRSHERPPKGDNPSRPIRDPRLT